jgi:hypothetical protein
MASLSSPSPGPAVTFRWGFSIAPGHADLPARRFVDRAELLSVFLLLNP